LTLNKKKRISAKKYFDLTWRQGSFETCPGESGKPRESQMWWEARSLKDHQKLIPKMPLLVKTSPGIQLRAIFIIAVLRNPSKSGFRRAWVLRPGFSEEVTCQATKKENIEFKVTIQTVLDNFSWIIVNHLQITNIIDKTKVTKGNGWRSLPFNKRWTNPYKSTNWAVRYTEKNS
jgi:hypothetical protein